MRSEPVRGSEDEWVSQYVSPFKILLRAVERNIKETEKKRRRERREKEARARARERERERE